MLCHGQRCHGHNRNLERVQLRVRCLARDSSSLEIVVRVELCRYCVEVMLARLGLVFCPMRGRSLAWLWMCRLMTLLKKMTFSRFILDAANLLIVFPDIWLHERLDRWEFRKIVDSSLDLWTSERPVVSRYKGSCRGYSRRRVEPRVFLTWSAGQSVRSRITKRHCYITDIYGTNFTKDACWIMEVVGKYPTNVEGKVSRKIESDIVWPLSLYRYLLIKVTRKRIASIWSTCDCIFTTICRTCNALLEHSLEPSFLNSSSWNESRFLCWRIRSRNMALLRNARCYVHGSICRLYHTRSCPTHYRAYISALTCEKS